MASGWAGSAKVCSTCRVESTLGRIMAGTCCPSKRKMVTMLCSAEALPSRLQRPAVWMIESKPASSRQAVGKSTSTPASISEVETTRQGSPLLSRSRISSSSRLRSAGQSRVVRQ